MENPEHLRPSSPDQTVIVVAEDEVMIRNIVRITLEAEGYFILAADDGEEALEIARKFPGTIHAVLSDVQMPKMDGLELRKRILEERPDTKVLLMSGYVDAAPGNLPFLRKPFTADILNERIKELLDSGASV
jgi:two-component system, cell cycle sensor histidine kinase and response regulator CckA